MHTPVGSAQHIEEHTKRLINLKSQREAQPTADNGPKVIQKKKNTNNCCEIERIWQRDRPKRNVFKIRNSL